MCEVDLLTQKQWRQGGSVDTTKEETELQEVDMLKQQSGDRTARGGSADSTKLETGLQVMDLLTQQTWRHDYEVDQLT